MSRALGANGHRFEPRKRSKLFQRLISRLTTSWVEKRLPHHSQGSRTERWSRNTMKVVTARVFYVLRVFLNVPFIFNIPVETAAPFNVVSHPRCCEPRNEPLEKFRPLAGFEPVTVATKCRVLNR